MKRLIDIITEPDNTITNMDTTTKKVIAETLGASKEAPTLSKENRALLKAAAEVQQAYQYWKLVDRDNDKLNAKLDEVRRAYKYTDQ
jgi:hypothetical protein